MKKASSDFHLVIHDVLQTDSGTYFCSVDAGHEKQHVTVMDVIIIMMNVRGIKNTVSFFLCMEYVFLYTHICNVYLPIKRELNNAKYPSCKCK